MSTLTRFALIVGLFFAALPALAGPVKGKAAISLWIRVTDKSTTSVAVQFGFDPAATRCVDPDFGESEFPPVPPMGLFDVRFADPSGNTPDCFGNGLTMDIHPLRDAGQLDTFEVAFQGTYPMTLTWPDLKSAFSGPVKLQDALGGEIVNVDMRSESSYVLTKTALKSLRIISRGPTLRVQRKAPSSLTLPADSVGETSAHLRASVNPHGFPTAAYFEWGPTRGYGRSTPHLQAGEGATAVILQHELKGLAPNTLYHYRIRTVSPGGTSQGKDRTFRTIRGK